MRSMVLLSVVSFLVASVVSLALPVPAGANGALPVYYAGPDDGVKRALTLTDDFVLVGQVDRAMVIVLNGVVPDAEAIARRIQGGCGLILILGPRLSAPDVGLLLGATVNLKAQDDPLSLTAPLGTTHPLATEVIWNSAPQIRERFILEGVLLEAVAVGFEDNSLILGEGTIGKGRVFVFTPFLGKVNPQFQDWAYFNYLIYNLVRRAAGLTPLPFADYPASPVPHTRERLILLGAMALLVVASLLAFLAVRRYSLAHPEILDTLIANRAAFQAHEADTPWEEVGFHRPLAGFLVALMVGLVLFIPLIIYQNLVLPVFILPSAQALGLWGRVTQFFGLAWQFFDMGTSVAFIKYMSEYRVHDPRKGIQYGQLFVWWQLLTGMIQATMVMALASTYVPASAYAIYAWSIIVHAFIQVPGFYQVMRHALMGLQRFDYAQMLDIGLNVLLPMLVQPVVVSLMYLWGQNNPVFGASMGGLLGMGMAAYAAEALTFFIGLGLYKRLGYDAHILFLAHFDLSVVVSGLRFGVFEMLGSIAWAAGQAAEIAITQGRLINYAEVWGNWVLAQNFVFAYAVLQTLFGNLMPAISEAVSHGRERLSQYYAALAYKYGGMISALIAAVLLAVADRFILGASGPEFTRAAGYAIPLIIWGAIQYPSWVGDNVQLAANRPYLKSVLVFGEQVLRVTLALILLEQLQVVALIIAYFVGLLSKDVVAYFVNHRLCYPQRFYLWQSLAAPLLAGAGHYAWLRWFTGLLWQGDQATSVLIFFLGILPSFPVFAFLYGLFGGWDDAGLEQLKSAVDLTGFVRPLAWLFWEATSLGARLSPLHGRFPIAIHTAALAEAQALTAERVML